MKRTRDIFKEARSPAASLAAVKAQRTEFPEFPPCSNDSSIYIDEIHYRAETVTPVLAEIPGYSSGHDKN
jgi:hypothetical protein